MGKIARVSARRLAYDQMKAERKQYILIANNNNNVNKKQLSENDINHFMKNIDKNNTSYFFNAYKLIKLNFIWIIGDFFQ